MQRHQPIDDRAVFGKALWCPWHEVGRGHPTEQGITDLAVVMPGAVRHPTDVRECDVQRERQPPHEALIAASVQSFVAQLGKPQRPPDRHLEPPPLIDVGAGHDPPRGHEIPDVGHNKGGAHQ